MKRSREQGGMQAVDKYKGEVISAPFRHHGHRCHMKVPCPGVRQERHPHRMNPISSGVRLHPTQPVHRQWGL